MDAGATTPMIPAVPAELPVALVVILPALWQLSMVHNVLLEAPMIPAALFVADISAVLKQPVRRISSFPVVVPMMPPAVALLAVIVPLL